MSTREWVLKRSWMKNKKKIKEGDRDKDNVCGEKEGKKKKTYGWNEGWERRNNIMNKKS